jgi:hypothetical protein
VPIGACRSARIFLRIALHQDANLPLVAAPADGGDQRGRPIVIGGTCPETERYCVPGDDERIRRHRTAVTASPMAPVRSEVLPQP